MVGRIEPTDGGWDLELQEVLMNNPLEHILRRRSRDILIPMNHMVFTNNIHKISHMVR